MSKKSDSKKSIIVFTGGSIDKAFACDFVCRHKDAYIIGVDKGLEFLDREGIRPDEIMGDFDSIDKKLLSKYESDNGIIRKYFKAEKDETDTQLAIIRATELVTESRGELGPVYILGAFGKRLDHLLGSIHELTYSFDRGVGVYLMDKFNKVYMARKKYSIKKAEQYGQFVSFIPLTENVEGLTLKGFKYNLEGHTLTITRSLGVSNEIVENEAFISYKKGYLLALESVENV